MQHSVCKRDRDESMEGREIGWSHREARQMRKDGLLTHIR